MTLTAITLEELGQTLREVREGQHCTLEQAARELRIRPIYLTALESGKWEQMPAQAYGRGYLRQYAAYLGLSTQEVMQIVDRLQVKDAPKLHYYETNVQAQAPSARLLAGVGLAALALLAGWYALNTPRQGYDPDRYALSQTLQAEWEHAEQGVPVNLPQRRGGYPPEALECMKILRMPRNPCYYRWREPQPPVLARKLAIVYW